MTTTDWHQLARAHPRSAVNVVQELFGRPGPFGLTADELAIRSGTSLVEATQLLEELAHAGTLSKSETRRCRACDYGLDDLDGLERCPHCDAELVDKPPRSVVQYELHRAPARDVPWVLVVHGMNTRGAWQEELSWLIGRSYRHMVPVAIYKYGKITPGVLFRFRQRQLRAKLITKIHVLSRESKAAGYGGVPDVIAHSFGTLLIAEALWHDSSIRLGRVILLGSIVRPDFPWDQLIAAGSVEAVLNHTATCDEWVAKAQYFIPGAGPSGVCGFSVAAVANIPARRLRHSSYFEPQYLSELFQSVWQEFLVTPGTPPHREDVFPGKQWNPPWWIVRLSGNISAISMLLIIATFAIAASLVGSMQIIAWLLQLFRSF